MVGKRLFAQITSKLRQIKLLKKEHDIIKMFGEWIIYYCNDNSKLHGRGEI